MDEQLTELPGQKTMMAVKMVTAPVSFEPRRLNESSSCRMHKHSPTGNDAVNSAA